MQKIFIMIMLLLVCFSGCDEKKQTESSIPSGMKCGAGKCGANMFEGSVALVKKKHNILSQMREDDSRRSCVQQALTTKAVYACVRDKMTGKLSTKCGTKSHSDNAAMKCGAGKCGGEK